MTTITLPEMAQKLREKRDGAHKTEAARRIGVSRQIYGAWEDGHYTPSDEWAEPLADYLDLKLRDVVWMLYRDRMNRAKGVYHSSLLSLAA
jgi:DNA-binding XRE family transcriptional regulator